MWELIFKLCFLTFSYQNTCKLYNCYIKSKLTNILITMASQLPLINIEHKNSIHLPCNMKNCFNKHSISQMFEADMSKSLKRCGQWFCLYTPRACANITRLANGTIGTTSAIDTLEFWRNICHLVFLLALCIGYHTKPIMD